MLVSVTSAQPVSQFGGYQTVYTLRPNDTLRVTRVFSMDNGTVIVRAETGRGAGYSFQIHRSQLQFTSDVPVRRLRGVKPDDTPEMTYIGIDHPGIQWLWDDLGDYANDQSWCHQYDDLAEAIGIPGRKENFNVSVTRGGVIFQATVRARSEEQAQELAEHALGSTTPSAQG